jgi:signal transduction histidine kinase
MQVEDQGAGFEPPAVLARHDSSGLVGIRERLLLLGGDMRIESTPGAGTSVTAELPLAESLERRRSER